MLQLLKEQYGIEEKILYLPSLRLYLQEAKGFSVLTVRMIMAYGQDDRICAFTSLMDSYTANRLQRQSMPVCG